ncbi:tetratricopeptide repeat protein [Desulfuribacillus alkaliarsenatis]|uniref:Tetratricopeptide repeat protein n=1 Tax=Desulfuribacillus alkaliarsenatis TaxID=766136 RepID=A0A1E5FYN3_9FIRM|nr:tetratricopeptide repeat protein [Desulfuribacillus alkaliarsenatis]OEF95682.1 hypothetical protein BHF68_11285 [Desulfuribacillus alkaliarsenatis]
MKQYIRFKVKHVITTIGALLAIIMLGYIFLPSALMAIGDNYRAKGETETAKVYYDRISQYFPRSGKTAEALEKAADITMNNNLLMITPKSVGGFHSRMNRVVSEEAKTYYLELAERFPNTFQGQRAITTLTTMDALESISRNRIDDALNTIKHYFETHRWPDTYIAIDIAYTLRNNSYYTEAIDLLKYVLDRDNKAKIPDLHVLLGDLYAVSGDIELAKVHYEHAIAVHTEIYELDRNRQEHEAIRLESRFYEEITDSIQNKIARLDNLDSLGVGIVTGSINLHGKPLSDIQIMLQPYNDPHSFPVGSPDALWTVSDNNGEFTFNNVTPGEYGLGFVVDLDVVGDVILKGGAFPQSMLTVETEGTYHWDFSLVDTLTVNYPIDSAVIEDDTINFSWEPLADAAYYTLRFGIYFDNGTSFGQGPLEKHYANQATVTMDDLISFQTGYSFDKQGPTPESLFGYAMPGGKYFWGVDAHAEDGTILTSSRGYVASQNTDFTISNRELLEADKLLLNREYGKAIVAYEKLLEESPNYSHALRMLAKIYSFETSAYTESFNFTDFDKAIEYYERLYKITGHTGYLDSIISIYYYSLDDFSNAYDTLKRLAAIASLNDWQHMQIASIEGHFGNYEHGLGQLLKAESKYYKTEAALRILTGITNVADKDHRWNTAMLDYRNNYQPEAIEGLLQDIAGTPALEAIDFLSRQDLTPNEAFIKLSMQMVEPALRKEQNDILSAFEAQYSAIDSKLVQIANRLYKH